MLTNFAYWSIGNGEYSDMMEGCVRSCRDQGIKTPFITLTDKPEFYDTLHPNGKNPLHVKVQFEKGNYLFKFAALETFLVRMPFDYFIFVDCDSFFVSKPPLEFYQMTRGLPVHCFLESCCNPDDPKTLTRKDWWKAPLKVYERHMKEKGVRHEKVYNVNAGFFVVHRNFIPSFCRMAKEFTEYTKSRGGHGYTEEPPLAYVQQMMALDSEEHRLVNCRNVWASDWKNHFSGRLPIKEEWDFEDYFSGQTFKVDPFLVHGMRSKQEIADYGRSWK